MKKVLIVVDMQNGFMNHENYKKLSKKIDEYITKSDYDLFVFTRFVDKENSLRKKYLGAKNMINADEYDLSIKVPKNSVVFNKHGYGLEKENLAKIKKLNVDTVDICGLQRDACVYAISFQLWDNGIYPNILINYTATDPNREKQAREMLIHQFGKVDEKL